MLTNLPFIFNNQENEKFLRNIYDEMVQRYIFGIKHLLILFNRTLRNMGESLKFVINF